MALKPQVKLGLIVLILLSVLLIGLLGWLEVLKYGKSYESRLSALEIRPSELKISVVTPTPTASPSATKAPVRKVTVVPTVKK